MKKYSILFLFIALQNSSFGQITDNLSFGLNYGIGFDMQEHSRDYTVFNTQFIIPSTSGSSVLRIQKPKRYKAFLNYSINENMDFYLSYGKTIRKLKYASRDTLGSLDNCLDCQLKIKIHQNDFYFGLRFQTNSDSRVNLYFIPSIGFTWIKSSSFYNITADDPQTELFSLHDDRDWYLMHVYQGKEFSEYGTISLNYGLGMSYRILKSLFLEFELNYNNELTNGSQLIIWGYDKASNSRAYGYSPFDMEFKTLYSTIGLRFHF